MRSSTNVRKPRPTRVLGMLVVQPGLQHDRVEREHPGMVGDEQRTPGGGHVLETAHRELNEGRDHLSRAERGKVMPSIISLIQIARALKVDKILLRVRSSK